MRFIKWFGICGILISTSLSAFPITDVTAIQVVKPPIGPAIAQQIEREAAADAAHLESADRCSSWGHYICPTTGETFDYDPPRCGGFTKPMAKRHCEAACDRTCQDAGWQ